MTGDQRLWRSVLQLSDQLDQRFNETRLIRQLGARVSAGDMAAPLLEHMLDSFGDHLPCDRIGIGLVSDDGEQLVSTWVRSRSENLRIAAGYAAPLAGSSLQAVIESGEPRILNDLEAYLNEHPESESTKRIVEEGMRSSLTCPLISVGRPVGVVFFSSMEPWTYSKEHVDSFRQVADQLSAVIERMRMRQKLAEAAARVHQLTLSLFPESVAERRLSGDDPIVDYSPDGAVMVALLRGIPELAARWEPVRVAGLLDRLVDDFHELIRFTGGVPVRSSAGRWLAVSGIPEEGSQPADLAELAVRFQRAVQRCAVEDAAPELELCVGIAAGPVMAAIAGGRSQPGYDVFGATAEKAEAMARDDGPASIRVARDSAHWFDQAFALEASGASDGRLLLSKPSDDS